MSNCKGLTASPLEVTTWTSSGYTDEDSPRWPKTDNSIFTEPVNMAQNWPLWSLLVTSHFTNS